MDGITLRHMTRDELDVLVEWAAAEGWNPGLDDAEVFWAQDPEAFIAAADGDELVGGGSIVSYDGHFGFMGFFIVRPDRRGAGLGNWLWWQRKNRLAARLDDPVRIGMDGVFAMQDYYAKGGFVFFARDLRYEAVGAAGPVADGIVDAGTLPFGAVLTTTPATSRPPARAFWSRG